jgi:single-strand DNA-binding protein
VVLQGLVGKLVMLDGRNSGSGDGQSYGSGASNDGNPPEGNGNGGSYDSGSYGSPGGTDDDEIPF